MTFAVEEQLELADRPGPKWPEFSKSLSRYTPTDLWYNLNDGVVYYSMLTTLRPKRIVDHQHAGRDDQVEVESDSICRRRLR